MFDQFNNSSFAPYALTLSLMFSGSALTGCATNATHTRNVVKSVVNHETLPARREVYRDLKNATNLPSVDYNKPVLENLKNIGTGVMNKLDSLTR